MHRIIYLGLYLILLTPLLARSGFLIPHITPKVLAFQALVEIVSAAVLILIPRRAARPAGTWKKAYPFSSPLVISITLFLGYSLLSSFFGTDVGGSLWGMVERQDGLVLLFHFLAWLVVLGWWFHNSLPGQPEVPSKAPVKQHAPARLKRFNFKAYLNFSFWVSSAVAMSAILEWLIFEKWGITAGVLGSARIGRSSGLFGNPIFLGPYLIFHFFYGIAYLRDVRKPVRAESAISSAAKSSKKHPKVVPLSVIIVACQLLMLAAIALGRTRGVVFGLAAGLFALGIGFMVSRSVPRHWKLAALIANSLLLAASISIWFFRDTSFVKKTDILNRLALVVESETAQMRWIVWQSALKGFRDHPVLGWGHDNSYYVFNRYYNPEQVRFDPSFAVLENTWFDKSHNAFIDLLVEKGLLGGLFFLGVAVTVALALRRMEDGLLACCITAGLIAYAASNFVAFDSFGSLFGLFLFLSYVAAVTAPVQRGQRAREDPKPRARDRKMTKQPRDLLRPALAVAGLAAVAAGLYVNTEIASALAGYREARSFFDQDPGYGMRIYREAFAHYSPYAGREKLKCAYAIINNGILQKLDLRGAETVNYALALVRDAIAAHPTDAQTYIRLNDMYNGLAIYMDRKFLKYAEAAGQNALELSPKRQEAIMNLGRTYLLDGQNQRAIELGRNMIREYPNLPVAHWFLGLSLLQAKQQDEAKQEISIAFRTGYNFQNQREQDTLKQLLGEKTLNELIQGK